MPVLTLTAVLGGSIAPAARAQYTEYVWSGVTNGNWSTNSNWAPNTEPVSGALTRLRFAAGGANRGTNNDKGTFLLNALTFYIEDATGTEGVHWSKNVISGTLTITATPPDPFTIEVLSVQPGTATPGPLTNFQPRSCVRILPFPSASRSTRRTSRRRSCPPEGR